MSLKVLTNTYERNARLLPALLTIFPLIMWLFLWFPEFQTVKATVINFIFSLGFSLAISIVARALGKKVQEKLILKWRGMPATIILSHSDQTLNIETKKRYHRSLASLIGTALPTIEEETENPLEARKKFDSCIDYLIKKTRNNAEYPLVFNENVSYGQARNLLGLKPIGLGLCFSLLAIQLIMVVIKYGVGYNISVVPVTELLSIGVAIFFLFFWFFFVSANSVYNAGVNYGKALLEVCEDIE